MNQHRDNRKPKFNDWHTPDYVFNVITELLGEEYNVDIDMFSSDLANKRVKAKHYFIDQPDCDWNMDYIIHEFSDQKLNAVKDIIECFEYGVFANCFLIMNANMETSYSQLALKKAKAVFFFDKRLSFIDARTNQPQTNNNKGQALYYFGERELKRTFTNDDGVLIQLR